MKKALVLMIFSASLLLVACAGTPDKKTAAAVSAVPKAAQPAGESLKAAAGPGESVEPFDLNQDGKNDVFKYFRMVRNPNTGGTAKVMVRRELDVNGDGKIDVTTVYDELGTVTEEHFDLDFDGRIDMVDYYLKGELARRAVDFQFDEKPDLWKFYVDGDLIRKEMDQNSDGRVDYWEYYENGALDRIGIDENGDGQVDKWVNGPAAEAAAVPEPVQTPPAPANP